ncbi:ribonuclease E/G [Magnetospirillum sp. UT-4]|uniref:ribonuclease E/G n=1 Tax=Magnetospirillum sp. UT-4 TaxID=2681467 RepID=UPI00138106DF|nr:ribonuclease E/G [Magnetospirillum sp. UT-4]CAA7622750.1 putative ribonucleases G(RNase G) and E [Magnetospirillum sp. UT-4]
MATDILYSWGPGESRIALVREGRLVEVAMVRPELLAGAVVLGRVVEMAPKLGAAFVDIGQDRPAFLQGTKGLTRGAAVLAQVRADAVGSKGATLSADIVLPGRLLAYSRLRSGVTLPKKLAEDKRARLLEKLEPLLAEGEGVATRIGALTASEPELEAELVSHRAAWSAIQAAAAGAPPLVAWRPDPVARLLADHPGTHRILVDDAAAFAELRGRFGALVEHHQAGPVFALSGVEDALQAAAEPEVRLPCGGRVAIEPTAALIAIDVDSGPATAAEANTQAVAVIARQLRLRNLSGQFAVDFVSGGGKGALLKLMSALKQAVAADPVATHVIGTTALGLIEMTRERRGPSLAELSGERDWRASAEALALAALRLALAEARHRPGRALTLTVAPDLAAALARRPQALAEAEARLGRPLTIRTESARRREDVGIEEV